MVGVTPRRTWRLRALLRGAAAVAALALLLGAGAVAAANAEIGRLETLAPEDGAPGQFVEVEGRRLHVRIFGDPGADPTGAPIVALHGFAAPGGETWMPWAESLAAGRAVIVPDLLNFGRSERVTAPSPELTHRGQARLLAGLLGSLGVGQADLLATSYGGAVGAQLMLDQPGLVRRAVLIDAQVYPSDTARFFQALGGLPLGVGRAVTWGSLGGAAGSFNGQRCAAGEEQCPWLRAARVRGTVDGLRAISATPQESRIPGGLGQIAVPTLVIWGADDQTVPLDEGRRLAVEIGAEGLEVIPAAGHAPYEEAPDSVRRLVLGFLGESSR